MLKNKLSDLLALPKEVITDLPFLSLIGNEELCIESFKSIVEYSEEKIRINTSRGIVKIDGRGLVLNEVSDNGIKVKGNISKIEFL